MHSLDHHDSIVVMHTWTALSKLVVHGFGLVTLKWTTHVTWAFVAWRLVIWTMLCLSLDLFELLHPFTVDAALRPQMLGADLSL
jgi:hypothetical protein